MQGWNFHFILRYEGGEKNLQLAFENYSYLLLEQETIV